MHASLSVPLVSRIGVLFNGTGPCVDDVVRRAGATLDFGLTRPASLLSFSEQVSFPRSKVYTSRVRCSANLEPRLVQCLSECLLPFTCPPRSSLRIPRQVPHSREGRPSTPATAGR